MKRLLESLKKIFCLKNLPYIALVIYALVTLYVNLTSPRIPWNDEGHAWTIAINCSVSEIFRLLKVEGHTILWFLCLKPLVIFRQFYPYPMLILNWLFSCLALLIMVKKAPFNEWLKIFVIFSAPFFHLYIYQARCYTLAIMLLFLAMALYKERLKRPFWFLTFLILSANTHIVAAIPAFYLGVMFLYDLYKAVYVDKIISKNIFSRVIIITELAFLYLFLSWFGIQSPDYNVNGIPKILRPVICPSENVLGFGYVKILIFRLCILLFSVFLFLKSKRAGIFWLLALATNIVFFCTVYYGRNYHIIFVFIYALMAYWIYILENPALKYKIENVVNLVITAFTMSLMFTHITIYYGNNILGDFLLSDKNLKNSKLYISSFPMDISVALPKMENEGVYLYDIYGRNMSKYNALKNYFKVEEWTLYFDEFAKTLNNSEEESYLITKHKFKKNKIGNEKSSMISVDLYREIYIDTLGVNFYIYRVKSILNEP